MLISNSTINITSKFTSQTVRFLSFRKIKNWYAGLSPKRSAQPPYSHVTQIGDPILRRKSDPIPKELIKSEEIKYLVEHLKNLLKKFDCVGLSAPQIGIPLKIFVMEFSEKRRKEFSPEIFDSRKMSIFPLTVSFLKMALVF